MIHSINKNIILENMLLEEVKRYKNYDKQLPVHSSRVKVIKQDVQL